MVQQTSGREKEKEITQSPIAHMVNSSIGVGNVVGRAFVLIKSRNMNARNVEVNLIVSMESENSSVQNVMGRAFVPMGIEKRAARNVMVEGCARLHIVFCFVHLFPTERVATDYRTKETTVVTFLQEKFPNVDCRWNKTVEGGDTSTTVYC